MAMPPVASRFSIIHITESRSETWRGALDPPPPPNRLTSARLSSFSGLSQRTHPVGGLLPCVLRDKGMIENVHVAGRGSCASVALTVDIRTGRRAAVKFIPRATCSGPSGLVLRELQNHKSCHGHPHIVELVVRPAPGRAHAVTS